MKSKLITTVSDLNNPGLHKLEASLKRFGWDYKILHDPAIGWDWGGWRNVYEWCKREKENPTGYTHIIYTDGFDTLALGTQAEADEAFKRICGDDLNKFVYSTEKNFFPHPQTNELNEVASGFTNEKLGLTDKNRWRYVNGGQYMASIDRHIEWYENAPKEGIDENNQWWANKYFIKLNDGRLKLDFGCDLFQTVAFTAWNYGDKLMCPSGFLNPSDYDLATFPGLDEFEQVQMDGYKRIRNKVLDKMPPLLHGNGHCDMKFVYDCLF